MSSTSRPIRASSVLPAHRQAIELHTADGLVLIGELAIPVDRQPVGTLITLHPLPTHGGYMDSQIFRKAAWRLPALAGLAVLRFNLRGVRSPQGTSEGTFDDGVGERFDVAAAIEFAEFHDLPNRWLVGWSFGTDLTLMHGLDPAISGAMLISPPLRYTTEDHLRRWADDGRRVLALVPSDDDFLRPPEAIERFAVAQNIEVRDSGEVGHLWVGENAVRQALEEICREVLGNPEYVLPTHWDGPATYHSDV